MASDLENIWRMLQDLDNGQLNMIAQLDQIRKEQQAGKEERSEMARLIRKLDDPDEGRVAKLEGKVVILERAHVALDTLKQRSIGALGVVLVLILFAAFGVTEGLRKILEFFARMGG